MEEVLFVVFEDVQVISLKEDIVFIFMEDENQENKFFEDDELEEEIVNVLDLLDLIIIEKEIFDLVVIVIFINEDIVEIFVCLIESVVNVEFDVVVIVFIIDECCLEELEDFIFVFVKIELDYVEEQLILQVFKVEEVEELFVGSDLISLVVSGLFEEEDVCEVFKGVENVVEFVKCEIEVGIESDVVMLVKIFNLIVD